MGHVVLDAPSPPRPEEFGLTSESFRAAPEGKIGPKRALCFVTLYGTAAVLVFSATLALSGSLIATVFFGVLMMAAGSVLLVPAVTGLVCALEHCEHCWLCRRHAEYRAVTEYRSALARYEADLERHRVLQTRSEEGYWRGLDHPQLVGATFGWLQDSGVRVELMAAEVDSGVDMVAERNGGIVAVRCVAKRRAAGRSLGRELVAAADDLGANELLLVAPWGATTDLCAYLQERKGKVVGASMLSR